jgi:hypothetical protein
MSQSYLRADCPVNAGASVSHGSVGHHGLLTGAAPVLHRIVVLLIQGHEFIYSGTLAACNESYTSGGGRGSYRYDVVD